MLAALALSLAVAYALSWFRGGFDETPFLVFTVSAFMFALLWQGAFRRQSLVFIEARLRRLPFSLFIRYVLILVALLFLVLRSGPMITSWGFAGWLLALLVWIIAPAVICPLVPHCPILFGFIAGGCNLLSLVVQDSRLYSRGRGIQWEHVFSQPVGFFITWCIPAALSLVFSIPVHVSRRAPRPHYTP